MANTNITNLPFKLYLGIGKQEGVQNNALFNEFVDRLKKHNYTNLNYKSDRYSGGHIHSTKNGFEKALHFIFN